MGSQQKRKNRFLSEKPFKSAGYFKKLRGMFGFLGKVKSYVADNVDKIKTEVNDFFEENKKLEEKEKIEEKRKTEAKLPWENIKIVSNKNGNIRDIIKEEILDLSNHEDTFLTEESNYMFEFDFNMEECQFQAIKIMEYDHKLGLIRNQLVPAKLSDEKFWKNYFYNVELIKMKYAIKAEEEAEEGITIQNEDDILRSEDNDEETLLSANKERSTEALRQKNQENTNNVQDKSKAFEIGNEGVDEDNNQTEIQAQPGNKNENPDIEINLQESH